MQKIIIIDTNVIANDPFFFRHINNSTIVVPMVVLEELDKLKSFEGIVGKNVRTFIHQLRESLKNKKLGSSRLVIAKDVVKDKVNDNVIIATSIAIKNKYKNCDVILYTNDINMQIKAQAKGVRSESFEVEKIESIYEENYSSITLTNFEYVHLSQGKELAVDLSDVPANKYFVVNDNLLARYNRERMSLKRIVSMGDGVMGLTPKNIEQTFALDALMDDSVSLVSLMGTSGCGKTILAISAALSKVLDEGKYTGVVIARPTVSMGKELGYLPGTMEEKILPWMQPFFDNIEVLMGDYGKRGTAQELIDQKVITLESLSHIRGRSFSKKFIIIDEAQNLDKHEIKTIITRAGEGTKIVLTGDVYQIDTKGLDIENNGLTYVTEKFKMEDVAAHVNLVKSERSKLAALAAKLL